MNHSVRGLGANHNELTLTDIPISANHNEIGANHTELTLTDILVATDRDELELVGGASTGA